MAGIRGIVSDQGYDLQITNGDGYGGIYLGGPMTDPVAPTPVAPASNTTTLEAPTPVSPSSNTTTLEAPIVAQQGHPVLPDSHHKEQIALAHANHVKLVAPNHTHEVLNKPHIYSDHTGFYVKLSGGGKIDESRYPASVEAARVAMAAQVAKNKENQ